MKGVVDSMFGIVAQLFLKFMAFAFKVFVKIMLFTGAWITFGLMLISEYFLNKFCPGLEHGHPYIYWIYNNVWGFIILLPTLCTTLTNVIRIVKRDGSFSFAEFAIGMIGSKKEKDVIKPKLDNELLEKTPRGVIFGKEQRGYIAKSEDKDGHILVIGGAGSGKSSSIAIPSLISWKERVFAIDIKGELIKKTGHKRTLTKVFNPNDPESYGYDPFYLIHGSDNIAQDMKELVLAIIPLPPNTKDPFWITAAQNYFTGALIYFYEQGLTFIEAITEIQKTPPMNLVKVIHESESELAKLFTNQFISIDPKTLSGIFTELSNKIMLFATDQQLRNALSKDEKISPDDLENGFDIYLCIEESKLEQWNCLLTLMVNQFLKHFEKRSDMDATPVLFLLDEFARLGKIEAITNGLATLRSKKITITILTQSLAQLDAIYGKEYRQIIADNCQYKAILNATDAETQEYFSKLVGTYDKLKTSHNSNFEQYTGLGKGTGVSTTTEEKRIIKPEEFATLKDVVLLTPYGFFRVDKAPYYENKEFQ